MSDRAPRPGGRPRASDPRDCTITIHVTTAEREAIRKLAVFRKRPMSQLITELVMGEVEVWKGKIQ